MISANVMGSDPMPVDPSAFDFRLDAGSPAIGAALAMPEVTHDYGGCARPNGAAPDIGAWER